MEGERQQWTKRVEELEGEIDVSQQLLRHHADAERVATRERREAEAKCSGAQLQWSVAESKLGDVVKENESLQRRCRHVEGLLREAERGTGVNAELRKFRTRCDELEEQLRIATEPTGIDDSMGGMTRALVEAESRLIQETESFRAQQARSEQRESAEVTSLKEMLAEAQKGRQAAEEREEAKSSELARLRVTAQMAEQKAAAAQYALAQQRQVDTMRGELEGDEKDASDLRETSEIAAAYELLDKQREENKRLLADQRQDKLEAERAIALAQSKEHRPADESTSEEAKLRRRTGENLAEVVNRVLEGTASIAASGPTSASAIVSAMDRIRQQVTLRQMESLPNASVLGLGGAVASVKEDVGVSLSEHLKSARDQAESQLVDLQLANEKLQEELKVSREQEQTLVMRVKMQEKQAERKEAVISALREQIPAPAAKKTSALTEKQIKEEKKKEYRARVQRMFEKYEPGKVDQVDRLVNKYSEDFDRLIRLLVRKFGPEPEVAKDGDKETLKRQAFQRVAEELEKQALFVSGPIVAVAGCAASPAVVESIRHRQDSAVASCAASAIAVVEVSAAESRVESDAGSELQDEVDEVDEASEDAGTPLPPAAAPTPAAAPAPDTTPAPAAVEAPAPAAGAQQAPAGEVVAEEQELEEQDEDLVDFEEGETPRQPQPAATNLPVRSPFAYTMEPASQSTSASALNPFAAAERASVQQQSNPFDRKRGADGGLPGEKRHRR